MRIINASCVVLSDPASKLEHDRWIASAESDLAEVPPRAETPKPAPSYPIPTPESAWKNWRDKYKPIGIFLAMKASSMNPGVTGR